MIGEIAVGALVVASAGGEKQADQVIALRDRSKKGVVFLWTGGRGENNPGLTRLKNANVSRFYDSDAMGRALRELHDYHA